MPVSTYREWEYGRSIRGEFYVLLAQALGVSLHELLTGQGHKFTELVADLEEIENALSKFRSKLIDRMP